MEMDRLKALSMYFGYGTLVMRDGSIHKMDSADLAHAGDSYWNVKNVRILEKVDKVVSRYSTGHKTFVATWRKS